MSLLNNTKVRKFLDLWFSDGEHQFGQQRDHYYDNLEDYILFIKHCYFSNAPCFHSVSPRLRLFKIFWEFDHDNKNLAINSYDSSHLDVVWEQVKRLALRITLVGAKPLILYSGNRGFHIWAFCKSTPIVYESAEEISLAKNSYKKMLFNVFDDLDDYPNFDRTPTHINALARVPFSFHQRTKNQVVPLTLSREPYIPDLQEFIDSPFTLEYKNKCMVEALIKSKRNYKNVKIDDFKVRESIKRAMSSNPDHNVRLAYIFDAIYAGMTDDEIHSAFKGYCPNDYDEGKTQYQLEYQRNTIQQEGIRPFSRDTLIRLGIVKEGEGWAKFD